MPRSTINDRTEKIFDANLMLRDGTAAAVSATTSETAIAFPARQQREFKAVLNLAAYTGYVAGTAAWTITIEESDTAAGTYYQIGQYVSKGVAEQVEIPLSGASDRQADVSGAAAFVRATATKTGAPGNLTYGAFLTKSGA